MAPRSFHVDPVTGAIVADVFSRPPNLVALLGDSRVSQVHTDGAERNISNRNHFGWGNALAGGRAVIAGNYGVSGDRTDQMLARLTEAVNSGAGWLYIHAGVNSITSAPYTATAGVFNGLSVSATQSGYAAFSDIKLAADYAILNGMRVLIVLDPGSTTLTAVQIGQLNELNERLRDYSEVTGPIVLFDLPFYVWNPTNSTTAIAFKAGYYADATHLASPGAYAAGKGFAELLTYHMAPLPREVRNIIESPSANSLVGQLANPMFSVTSGGTASAGATGTVPGSWTVNRASGGSGTQSVVVSTGTPADGSPGNECILACTFSAAGDTLRLQQDLINANWSAGDLLQASCEVSVDAGGVLAQAYIDLQVVTDTSVNTTTTCLSNITNAQATAEAHKVSLVTEKITVQAHTVKNFATFHVFAVGSAAGTATIRVRRAQVKKRFQ